MRLIRQIHQQFYNNHRLSKYLKMPTTELSIESLCRYGHHLSEKKLFDMSNFVKDQISIRLAKRINDFQALPFVTVDQTHLQQVYELYWNSFSMFSNVPYISTMDQHLDFLHLLRKNLRYHLVVIPKIALGIQQAGINTSPDVLNSFAHSILRSRISRRVLAQQLLKLSDQFLRKERSANEIYNLMTDDGDIGVVSTRLNLYESVNNMYNSASSILLKNFQIIPKLVIDGNLDIRFTAIKDHLNYILLELFKNSIESTIRWNTFGEINSWKKTTVSNELPPIQVTLVQNESSTIIRLSDQGGGIPEFLLKDIFKFTKSESKEKVKSLEKLRYFAGTPHEQVEGKGLTGDLYQKTREIDKDIALAEDLQSSDNAETLHEIQDRILKEYLVGEKLEEVTQSFSAPLHLGLGLPMSKVFLDCWKSSITIQSNDGFGTDIYLFLKSNK
eukprot:NODE_197_length_13258_cov_0.852344.p4 type:complete len:444 gc:universal NODE_197_length_13258_cov_0.852344:6948-8279(+)